MATHRLCFCMCGSHSVCMCGSHTLKVNVPHKVSKCVNIRKGFQCVDTCCFYVWQPKFERICSHSKHQDVSYTNIVSNMSTHIVSMCGIQCLKGSIVTLFIKMCHTQTWFTICRHILFLCLTTKVSKLKRLILLRGCSQIT